MMHKLLIIFVLFLQGVKTINLMLDTNETLFSIAQCSMSDSKFVLRSFSNRGALTTVCR
jgi:hypothetical protein